jgi:ubiquinone/menaquinone biosynthesis C-methylase UbiE
MQTRTEIVKEYFNETDIYLKDNLEIPLRCRLIQKTFPDPENKNILDIGCGNGDITLPYIKKNKITFVDLSDKMLEIVRSKIPAAYSGQAEFLNIDLDKFGATKKYDHVFMIGVLAHVNSLPAAFSRLAGLVDKEGTLIIQFTNRKNFSSFMMRVIFKIKRMFGKGREYKMNKMSVRDITRELDKNRLEYYHKAVYWSSLPGFGLLPKGFRKFIYYKVLNSRLLRPLGGEVILFISAAKNK